MKLLNIYEWGKRSPIKFKIDEVDKKLKFVEFPYDSKAVMGVTLGFFITFFFINNVVFNIKIF